MRARQARTTTRVVVRLTRRVWELVYSEHEIRAVRDAGPVVLTTAEGLVARSRSIIPVLKCADLLVVTVAFIAAIGLALRGPDLNGWVHVMQLRISVQNVIYFSVYLVAWHFVLRGVGLYRSYRLAPAAREVGRIGVAVVIAGAPIYPLAQLVGSSSADTRFLLAFVTLAFLGLTVERRGLRLLARFARRHGMNLKNAVIVGEHIAVSAFAAKLSERGDLGYRILETIDLAPGVAPDGLDAVKRRIDALAHGDGLDEVFLMLPIAGSETCTRKMIAFCEETGITVRVLAHIANLEYARLVVDEVAGQPVLSVVSGPRDSLQLAWKRAIDIVGSLMGLALLSPFLIAVAVAIKLDSRGPSVFVQERIGQNRRRFKTYKFRTMVEGADRAQNSLEHLNEAQGPVFKIKEDPRMTRMGRWLRQTSIDELPQLFNVLTGDMSLVGPRPLPVRDVERMDVRWHRRRFAVQPGITCLWQVKSRKPEFDEWIKSDMEYIDRWSLKLDMQILLRTIPAVLVGNGAH
jgi:exopolysaccharide biosynthesis polyprenyl glycosylphosphotransferase